MPKIFFEIKSQLNKDIKQKIDELEKAKVIFIEGAISFCINWVSVYAEREAVQNNLSVTEKLGVRLWAFRNEVMAFSQKIVPELVKKEFSQEKYWPNYEMPDEILIEPRQYHSEYHPKVNQGPKIMDHGLRLVVGNLGPILKKYGYLEVEENKKDMWEEDGVPCYPVVLSWSKELVALIEDYAQKVEQLQRLNFELAKTIKEEKQNKVKIDWFSPK
jgi:hypothetical protein